jgi:hypothetical protein
MKYFIIGGLIFLIIKCTKKEGSLIPLVYSVQAVPDYPTWRRLSMYQGDGRWVTKLGKWEMSGYVREMGG